MGDPRAVAMARLPRWVAGFEERHGPWTAEALPDAPGWLLRASDGALASVSAPAWFTVDRPGPVPFRPDALAASLPSFGIIVVRRAGYAVAHAVGGEVVASKVGSRHIHGRTAAGGWSQKRYARRRDNQAHEVVAAAARAAERLLVGAVPVPAFLVTGGDRALLRDTWNLLDPALAALPVPVHVGTGTPTPSSLAAIPGAVVAVGVVVTEPPGAAEQPGSG